MVQKKRTKGQTIIYNLLNRKSKDRATRTPLKMGVISGTLEGKAVLAPHVAPVVLI
jgi:hypothetical protein